MLTPANNLYHSYGLGEVPSVAPPQPSAEQPFYHAYALEVVLTANQLLESRQITLDNDAPFFLLQLTAVKTGDFRFRLGDNEGRWYSSAGRNSGSTVDRVRDANMFGSASLPFILPAPIVFPPNGNIRYDIEDVSGAGNTVAIAFHGYKLYRR